MPGGTKEEQEELGSGDLNELGIGFLFFNTEK